MTETSTRSRLPAPAEETLTEAQRAIVAAAIRSLGGVYGPRIPLLHSQDVAVAWSQMGRALKTSALDPALRELTILVVGQYWKAEFEWHAHAPKAAAAGITEKQLDALKRGLNPQFEDDAKRIVHAYVRELVVTRQVSDVVYAAAKALLGERQLVDLTVLAGHFTNVAMTLNAHRVQLPPGVPTVFDGEPAQSAPAAHWFEKEGVALRYRLRPGTGPTLVFVHELGGTAESWDACIAQLPPGTQTLSVEWRGSGLSSKLRAPVAFEQMVEDLCDVVADAVGDGPVVLIGVAAGAAMALRMAARYGSQVRGVVATVPALGTPAEQRAGTSQMADRIEREGMKAMMGMERTYPTNLRDAEPGRWELFRLRYLGNDPTSYAHLLRMVMDVDLSADIGKVECPALVLGGEFDIRPLETMQKLATQLPQGQFEVVPAGHFMSAQAPDLLASSIARFVAGLPANTTQGA